VVSPKSNVRRFDVFAEYTRLEKLSEGFPAEEAKGYAIWLAKVVAARKYGRLKPGAAERKGAEPAGARARKFRSLSGIEQTDEMFDKQIVERMGKTFYRRVFSPAIREAFKSGKSYREIRDSIRKHWHL
jgi:hypothetical protein